MKKQPELTAKTRREIIDAFWELYREKRIEKITVKEICLKAGYNRSTFYEYFLDIYDVLQQLENELIPTFDELPPFEMSETDTVLPIHTFMKMYEQNGKYYSLLLGENGDPAFASKIKNQMKTLIKPVLSVKSNLSPLEQDYYLEFNLSALIGLLSYWFSQNKSLPADKLIDMIYENSMGNGIKHFK